MGSKLRIHPAVLVLAALWLLMLPTAWSMGIMLSACIHELAHFLAVLLCGGQVFSVSLTPTGARMETAPLSPGKEALCALAGPLGSFSLMFAAERFPEAAICGLVQGVCNLIPVYPLDGGRILRCLIPKPLCLALETFFLILLSGMAFWLMLSCRNAGMMALISLWIPVIQRKFSCKESKVAVQ